MRELVLAFLVAYLAHQACCCSFQPGETWRTTTYAEGHVVYFGPGDGGMVQAFESLVPVSLADFFVYSQTSAGLAVTMVSGINGCAIGERVDYNLSFSPDCVSAVLLQTTGSDACDPLGGEHRRLGCAEANEDRCFLSEGNYFVEVEDDEEGGLNEFFVGPRSESGDSSPLSVVEFVGSTNATVFMRWSSEKYYESTSSGPSTFFEASIAGLYKPAAGIETPQTTPSFCSSSYTYGYRFEGPDCSQIRLLLDEGSSCVDTISRLGGTSGQHVCANPLTEYWGDSYWIYWSSLFSDNAQSSVRARTDRGQSSTSTSTAALLAASGACLLASLIALA